MTQTISAGLTLSEDAVLLHNYISRFAALDGCVTGSLKFIRADLRTTFPLFDFLFCNEDNIAAAEAELDRAGFVLTGALSSYHPSLRVAAAAVDAIIRNRVAETINRMRLDCLPDIVASESVDENVFFVNKWLQWSTQQNLANAVPLARCYAMAQQERCTTLQAKTTLLHMLADYCGMTETLLGKDCHVYRIALGDFNAPAIVPRTNLRLGFVVLSTEADHQSQLATVSTILEDYPTQTLVIVILGRRADFRQELNARLGRRATVVLDEGDLKLIGLTSDHSLALRTRIVQQLSLELLSPYIMSGPVTHDIFFGRDKELRRILDTRHANFCVLGARRIGKSSLLRLLEHKVNEGKELENTVAIYIDASTHHRLGHFQHALSAALTRTVRDVCRVDAGPQCFQMLAEQLKEVGQCIMLLIDEIDELLDGDDTTPLEAFVRSLSNEGLIRSVVSGFRSLSSRIRDRSSCFYNLFDPISLGALSRQEACDLIVKPFTKMCVRFESEGVLEKVLDYGSTVPWLLQCMCHQLLIRLDKDGGRRLVCLRDVQETYEGSKFSQALTSVLVDPSLKILDKLVIHLLAGEPDGLGEAAIYCMVRRAVGHSPFDEVRSALRNLEQTHVLYQKGDKFKFCVPQMGAKLGANRPEWENVVQFLAEEYREKWDCGHRGEGI